MKPKKLDHEEKNLENRYGIGCTNYQVPPALTRHDVIVTKLQADGFRTHILCLWPTAHSEDLGQDGF